jgi:hypothetical protein
MADLFNKLYATYLLIGFVSFWVAAFTLRDNAGKFQNRICGCAILTLSGCLAATLITVLVAIWVF